MNRGTAINFEPEAESDLLSNSDPSHDAYISIIEETSKTSLFKRHKKKFMALITVGVAALIVIIGAVVVLFAVVPGYIRSTVSSAKFQVQSLSLVNPGSSSVELKCTATLDKTAPVPASILSAPFTFSFGGKVIGTIIFPDISLKAMSPLDSSKIQTIQNVEGTTETSSSKGDFNDPQAVKHELIYGSEMNAEGLTPIQVHAPLEITDMNAFAAFAQAMIKSETIEWSLYGKTQVKIPLLFGMKVDVTVDKHVTMPGMQGFKQLTISDVDFKHSDVQDVVMKANVIIHNPSVVSMDPAGILKLAIYYKNHFMGYAHSEFTVIQVGKNTIPVKAILKPENIDSASELISHYLGTRPLQLNVKSPPINASSIPLYDLALQGLEINTTFVQDPPILLIPAINVLAMDLTPIDNYTSFMSVSLFASIDNPLGPNCPLVVQNLSVEIQLAYKNALAGSISADAVIVFQNQDSIEANASSVFHINKTSFVDTGRGAFSQLLYDIENTPEVTITFSGNAHINASVLALGDVKLTYVPMNVQTKLAGLNRMPGTELIELRLNGNATGPPGSGLKVSADAVLVNPSVLSMHLGDVDMDLFVDGSWMGRVTEEDFNMYPGPNFVSVDGILRPVNMDIAGAFFVRYMFGKNSSAVINGTLPTTPIPRLTSRSSSVAVQQQSLSSLLAHHETRLVNPRSRFNIDWLNEAIESLSVQANIPALQNFTLFRLVHIQDLSLRFVTTDVDVKANGTFVAYYNLPFQLDHRFDEISLDVNLTHKNLPIGRGVVRKVRAITLPENAVEISATNVVIGVTDVDGFTAFLTELFLQQNTTCGFTGFADAKVDTNAGVVPFTDVPINITTFVNGTNRFIDPPVTIGDLDLIGGVPGTAYVTLNLNITNRSSADLLIGKIVLSLTYQGMYIGNGTIEDMDFYKGINQYPVSAIIVQTSTNGKEIREVLSQFMQSLPIMVSLEGTYWSTNVTILRGALANLVAPTTLPGFPGKLITFARLVFNLTELLGGRLPAKLTVVNPFTADIKIIGLNIEIAHNGERIAVVDRDFRDNPIVAKGKATTTTPEILADIKGISLDLLWSIIGTIKVEVKGTLDVFIGSGWVQQLDYVQRDIPASFQPPFTQNQEKNFKLNDFQSILGQSTARGLSSYTEIAKQSLQSIIQKTKDVS